MQKHCKLIGNIVTQKSYNANEGMSLGVLGWKPMSHAL